jgi:hypothetical protein
MGVPFEKNVTVPVGVEPPPLAVTVASNVGVAVSRKLAALAGVVDNFVVVFFSPLAVPMLKLIGAETELP